MIEINFCTEISDAGLDEDLFRSAVQRVLASAGYDAARIGIAVVDDATIQQLNRRFLNHDYPTDVITFPLPGQEGALEGEIVVNLDMARRQAGRYRWEVSDELLLYVVHGALHLVGFDDQQASDTDRMREKEREILAHFGRYPCYDETKVKSSPKLEEAM